MQWQLDFWTTDFSYFKNVSKFIILTVFVSTSGTQMRVRDSSATRIFFKKNRMMQHWAQKLTTKF